MYFYTYYLMSLCKGKLVFVLTIIATLFSGTESLCLWDFAFTDLIKKKTSVILDFVFEVVLQDEVYESNRTGISSESCKLLETVQPSKADATSKADAASKADDTTQAQKQGVPQKCAVVEDPSNIIKTCEVKRTAQGNIQFTEDKFQTPTYHTSSPLFDFNFDTHIKFSSLEDKPSFNVTLNCVVLILWVLTVALVFFLMYRKIEIIGTTVESLKEKIENGQEWVNQGHTCQYEERYPELTTEEVLCHLKQISETAKNKFIADKTVEDLSDEFLTKIVNFMMDHQKYIRYLTPYDLIQHAKYQHRLLRNPELRRKERKVKVYVNVNEAGFENSKSIE